MAKKKPRIRHVQLSLDRARRPMGHGGWRPGAGRPRTRSGVSHDAREIVSPTHPQHVTLRIVGKIVSLRRRSLTAIIRDAIAKAHGVDFRVVHFNVESNHLHLIIEASSNLARTRGLQGLEVRLARRLNRAFGRTGKLFADRYHARPLKQPREVRNALRYVLNNARHHVPDSIVHDRTWIDPCSSAAWFDGWREPVVGDTWWKRELLGLAPPVARPTVWLLTTGWHRHGRLAFDEVPGARAR
jgi:REP element-mobilizing transposase RayT